MKSKAQVITENSEFKTLINAVINTLGGTESVNDINDYGMEGGFSGFISHTETHAFAMRYRKLIVKLLNQKAEEMGTEAVEMVSSFGAFRNSPMDSDDKKQLYKYLGGGRNEQSTITNLMAWFAAEEVCRWFEN